MTKSEIASPRISSEKTEQFFGEMIDGYQFFYKYVKIVRRIPIGIIRILKSP